jgi:hypothetical protein
MKQLTSRANSRGEEPMTVFETAIGTLGGDERNGAMRALSIMGSTGKGARIAQNLQLERFLPVPLMTELLLVLSRSAGRSATEILEAFAEECHKYVCQGGDVRCDPFPRLLGRAVSRVEFEKHLELNCGGYFHGSRRAISEFMERVFVHGSAPSAGEADLPMSAYAAWVTSDHESASRDQPPFTFLRSTSALELECALGLPPDIRKPLLLLIYEGRSVSKLLRPTIADAGSYEFFMPPPSEECCGRTCPWPAAHLPSDLRYAAADRHSEAIHPAALIGILRIPVETIP